MTNKRKFDVDNINAEQFRELVQTKKEISFNTTDDPLVIELLSFSEQYESFKDYMDKGLKDFCSVYKVTKDVDLISAYKNILQSFVNKIDALEKNFGTPCCCTKGCDACCYGNMITITYQEAQIIKKYMYSNAFTNIQRELIISRIIEQSAIIHGAGIYADTVTAANHKGEELSALRKKYYELKLPCVFLHNGKCMVYAVRPLDCFAFRQYVSSFFCENSLEVVGSHNYDTIKLHILATIIGEKVDIKTDTIAGMMSKVLKL